MSRESVGRTAVSLCLSLSASVNSQEVEDEGEEEGVDGEEAPDYENLQELN